MSPLVGEKSRARKIVDAKVVFTASFVLGLLFLVILRTNGWRFPLPSWIAPGISSAPAGPEDAIYGMLDAARAGDTQTYLDSFSGALRDQLVQVVKENAEPSFAAYLKSQNSAFQGVAVSVTDRPSDTEAQCAWSTFTAIETKYKASFCRKIRDGESSKFLAANKSRHCFRSGAR